LKHFPTAGKHNYSNCLTPWGIPEDLSFRPGLNKDGVFFAFD